MQLLPAATDCPAPRAVPAAPAAALPDAPGAAAAAVLDAVPAVMWFVRRQMRCRRTKGLSVPQFRTLVLIRRYPGASLSLVAENLGSSMPTASRIVTGLVSRGFLTRRGCDNDRRQLKLDLTERGQAAHDAALAGTRAAVADRLAALDPAERSRLVAAMAVLAKAFATGPCDPLSGDSPPPDPSPLADPGDAP